MKLLGRISRAIARFNDRVGPTIAAESMVRSEGMGAGGGTDINPAALHLLDHEPEQQRSEEPHE